MRRGMGAAPTVTQVDLQLASRRPRRGLHEELEQARIVRQELLAVSADPIAIAGDADEVASVAGRDTCDDAKVGREVVAFLRLLDACFGRAIQPASDGVGVAASADVFVYFGVRDRLVFVIRAAVVGIPRSGPD